MGAGSAKGLRSADDDDDNLDRYSTTSDQWDDQEESVERNSKSNKQEHVIKAVTEIPPLDPDLGHNNEIVKKEENKKRGLFKFNRKKESVIEKNYDSPDDNGENEKKNKENKKNSEKNNKNQSLEVNVISDKKSGFRLFGWGKEEEKNVEKEIQLDHEINDLERTFDSLGIVGRNIYEEEQNNQQQTASDDLALLEPMRKRKQVRTRIPNGIKGPTVNGGGGGGGDSGGSSGASRRTFKYSWETNSMGSRNQEEDAWDYQAVVIEGFDIEKFKRANKKETIVQSSDHYSNSLPNSVGDDNEQLSPLVPNISRGMAEPIGGKSSLFYDSTEQHLLASIERDFTV